MASSKFDLETFRDRLIELIQDNLSDKIAEINTEKNDDYSLETIDSSNYYNDITDQIINVNPFIYYGFFNLEPTTVGGSTATQATIFVSVVFSNRNKNNTETKVLRYTRCLKEIILDNFKKFPSTSALKVTEFSPTDFTNNKGSDFKVGGIHITATIT